MPSLRNKLAEIYESPPSASRIVPMEGVRGLAVLLVFFVHFNALFRPWAAEGGLTDRIFGFLGDVGHSGVDLFFVLSGYLIYGAVISKETRYGHFMARRIDRIYPPFLAVFAVYLGLSVLFPAESKIPGGLGQAFKYLLENLLLLPGIFNVTPMITVAWSLSYEIFYYLLIPAIVLWFGLRKWGGRSRAVFFWGLAAAYTAYCTLDIQPRLQLIMFVSGILLFEALRSASHAKNPAQPKRSDRSTWKLDVLGLAALVITLPVAYLLMSKSPLLDYMPGLRAHGWFAKVVFQFHAFLIFLYACFRSNSFLGMMFSGRFMRYLGNMSYSYYLIHGLALKFAAMILAKIAPPTAPRELMLWAILPLAFAATWAASTVLFAVIEKRFSLSAVRRPHA